jgi:hypothetical protein
MSGQTTPALGRRWEQFSGSCAGGGLAGSLTPLGASSNRDPWNLIEPHCAGSSPWVVTEIAPAPRGARGPLSRCNDNIENIGRSLRRWRATRGLGAAAGAPTLLSPGSSRPGFWAR